MEGTPLSVSNPELAAQASGWDPTTLSAGSHRRVEWRCEHGHVWTANVKDRARGAGCPYCSGNRVLVGFNDLTTDKAGRVYVGSLAFMVFGGGEAKPGNLVRIDLDGSIQVLSDGVMLTNGLGFSPDGKRLYHSDSRVGVRVYDVAADGTVGPWRLFADLGSGLPDGLKVAADGSIWVADAHGGRVAVFEPDGSHRMDVAVPIPMVTSLCFGGEDLRDLYIVTGSERGPRENCGTVFRTRVEVAGQPLAPCRVKLNG